ncbi:hypothetical protein AXF42_Ash013110 [Apostasia shenzhenica]|uniref:Uncharacterized protein n=1 Tax=Apostasia shenzhenica TaxID=1088818 RepID=A0A2I0BD37_9ASPA|nr:hypothetical protein AXF42_Ash013110 [Apostasia shenzhenica]
MLGSRITSKTLESNTIMKAEVVDNVEVGGSQDDAAGSKLEMKAAEVKQSYATSTKASDTKQPTKKRITPVAIN